MSRWSSVVLVLASVVLAIVISGVYGNATVSTGELAGYHVCGSVWEPNAGTSVCAAALRGRSWKAVVLLGLAAFGAVAAVLVVGRPPRDRRRQLAVTGIAMGLVTIVSGLIWAGVIDRTVGT